MIMMDETVYGIEHFSFIPFIYEWSYKAGCHVRCKAIKLYCAWKTVIEISCQELLIL